jgi:hypothetical protein
MDEAARARRAARETVDDVEPDALRGLIDQLLESRSMSPGALVVRAALLSDEDVASEAVSERAAGVQLIYDGLRLTRELAHDEPWTEADRKAEADMSILAADVMVARGFYLLARTNAAGKAVDTVRSFGRDQTHHRENSPDDTTLDTGLETDALELAVIAGTTVTGIDPDEAFVETAARTGDALGVPLPPADQLFAELDTADPTAMPAPDDSVSAPDS